MKKLCTTCYGKGYYSILTIVVAYDDFASGGYVEPAKIDFKQCPKCKSRKKIPPPQIIEGQKYRKTFS